VKPAAEYRGPSGAAVALGMPASTLESKIRPLKIDKYRFKTNDSRGFMWLTSHVPHLKPEPIPILIFLV
jgi:hypothetical protein